MLSIQELDLPEPLPHQVVLDVFASSIQHAQVQRVQEPPATPSLLGSEATGRVIAAGDAVTRVQIGDVVLVSPLAAEPTCRTPEVATVTLLDGTTARCGPVFTWASATVVDEQLVTPLPQVALDRDGAAVLGVTLPRAVDAVGAGAGGAPESIAVFGAGSAGQAVLLAARAAGITRRIAVDSSNVHLDRATRVGATDIVRATTADDAIAAIKELTGGGVSRVVVCLDGQDAASRAGTMVLERGGTAVLVAAAGTDERVADAHAIANERGYVLATGTGESMARCLEWFAARTLDPSALVTDRFTIEQVNEATMQVEDGQVAGAAILVFEPVG